MIEASRPGILKALSKLRESGFPARFVKVLPGRELQVLADDDHVASLSVVVAAAGRAEMEGALDELFKDLREGELFEHSEVAVALLYAIRNEHPDYAKEVGRVFAASKRPELSRMRQFSRVSLLEPGVSPDSD